MVFSDTTNKLGLVELTQFLTSTTITQYPLAEITRNVNMWYRTVIAWIWQADGVWQWDDSTYTNLPIAKTDVTTGQNDYAIPANYGSLERVEYKDSSGIWKLVKQIDKSEISFQSINEFYKTNGTPIYYDLFSDSIWLYPAPDRTSTDGNSLRLYVTRDAPTPSTNTTAVGVAGGFFISTDTTREPGFNRNFHPILAYGASYEWAVANARADKLEIFRAEIDRLKVDLIDYYSTRNKNYQLRIRPRYEEAR